MRIYLAARYSRIDELNGYADDLRALGHVVDARWLNGNHQIHEKQAVESATMSVPIEGQQFAVDDCVDILCADCLVAFSEPPRSGASRGGRHVELGLALAWGKRVIVVGPRENVFHTLPQVEHFWTWGEVVEVLR